MRCLAPCDLLKSLQRAPKLRKASVCLTGVRTYSFASDIQHLLKTFDTSQSKPLVSTTGRQGLVDFHRDVANSKISIKYILRQYRGLQRSLQANVLPAVTATLFLRRLLRHKEFDEAVCLLLEYDLGDAVSITADALQSLEKNEHEYSLFKLHAGLLGVKQRGLAAQVLVQLGLTDRQLGVFRRLVSLQSLIARTSIEDFPDVVNLATLLIGEMRNGQHSTLDSLTVELLVHRAIILGAVKQAKDILKDNWHAVAAVEFFLSTLEEDAVVEFLLEHIIPDPTEHFTVVQTELCCHVIDRIKKLRNFELLSSKISSDNLPCLHRLALRTGRRPDAVHISLSRRSNFAPDVAGAVIFKWLALLPTLDQTSSTTSAIANAITDVFSAMENVEGVEVVASVLQQIKQSTSAQYHEYPIQSLMTLLRAADSQKLDFPPDLLSKMNRHFSSRPAHEVLQHFQLNFISCAEILEIVEHHFHFFRMKDRLSPDTGDARGELGAVLNGDCAPAETRLQASQDTEKANKTVCALPRPLMAFTFYQDTAILLHRRAAETTRITSTDVRHFHDRMLSNLVRLRRPKWVIRFLDATRAHGITMNPESASHLIRSLSLQPRNHRLIVRLFKEYPLTILHYDIYARYISRISCSDPASAMALLATLIEKGALPRRRLLQNMMTGISDSETIAGSRAFRYISRLIVLSGSIKLPMDRIYLAALFKTVLVRQGLAASTSRIAWLLDKSAAISYGGESGVNHAQVLEMLGRWRIHERTRGLSGHHASRPKQLRELVERMGYRASVVGTGKPRRKKTRS